MENASEHIPDRIALGSRIFRVSTEVSVDQHLFITGHAYKAGFLELHRRAGEDNAHFMRRLVGELAASGVTTKLLGGLLLPEEIPDLDWTPKLAEDTARFIGQLRSPEDMETVRNLVASLLLDFFVGGMVSVWSSETSSSEPSASGGETESHPDPATIAMGNGAR